jgi:cytochrome c553
VKFSFNSTLLLSGIIILAVILTGTAIAQVTKIKDTKHNLSVTGPGDIKATSETRICVFCHTPHSANTAGAPLWGRSVTGETFITYDSETLDAEPGQPDGASLLCLSCHDGSLAVGTLYGGGTIAMEGTGPGGGIPTTSPGYVGTNLQGSHPVSFVFDANLAAVDGHLNWPINDPDVKLDAQKKVQCTACHDPHADKNNDPTFPDPLWIKTSPTNNRDDVCVVCHAW